MNVTPIHLDRLSRALAAEGVKLPRTRLLAVAASAFGCRNVHELAALDRQGGLAPIEPADLGVTDVPHIGSMHFLRDPSGYVYAVQDDAMSALGRGQGWHLAPMGGLARFNVGKATDNAPVELPTETLRIEDDEFAVELEYIGEGEDGDYDPSDPDDCPLYRFSVERLVDGKWEYVEDTSYCTQIDARISRERALLAARYLLDQVLINGRSGLKRLCEGLSWVDISRVEQAAS